MELYEADLNKYYGRRQNKPEEPYKPTHPIELLVEQYFIPFLVNYFKEIKQDSFTFLATPEVVALLESIKIGVNINGFYELAKMNKD